MTKKENVLFVLNLMFSQWMDCPLQHPGTHLFRKAVIPLKLEHIPWPSSLKGGPAPPFYFCNLYILALQY